MHSSVAPVARGRASRDIGRKRIIAAWQVQLLQVHLNCKPRSLEISLSLSLAPDVAPRLLTSAGHGSCSELLVHNATGRHCHGATRARPKLALHTRAPCSWRRAPGGATPCHGPSPVALVESDAGSGGIYKKNKSLRGRAHARTDRRGRKVPSA